MTVFLRPQPAAIPTDYHRVVGKIGLLVMPQRNLAIYTCKAGPNQGPQGEQGNPGVDQNSWYDCIIAAATDEYTPIPVSGALPKTTYRCPYALDLTSGYVRMSLTTAPTGAKFIVDVLMNGTTLFSTLISIDIDEKTSVTAVVPAVLSTTYIPDDAEFQVFVTQNGSVIAGTGLKATVTGIKTT